MHIYRIKHDFGRGLLQESFLKFWFWKKLHDVKNGLFDYDVISDTTTELL